MSKKPGLYHIEDTDLWLLPPLGGLVQQLFSEKMTTQEMKQLINEEEFAETAEAFASRFGRFQDTIGGKLLPLWLKILGERPTSFIDNLIKQRNWAY